MKELGPDTIKFHQEVGTFLKRASGRSGSSFMGNWQKRSELV